MVVFMWTRPTLRGATTSSAASARSSSPSWPQSLHGSAPTLLLPWHLSGSKEVSARYFYFGFSCSCARGKWLQSIERSIRWKNHVWNQDAAVVLTGELFDLFFPFPFFSPFFFLVLLNFFFFLFPATWSQSHRAWCLYPVLTPVITQ